MKSNISEEIHLKKPFFADVDGEQVVELALPTLIPFENHPFKVLEDEKMTELVESIEKYGVASPIIVREKGRGMYEIIAGHRRTKACEILGKETITAFIRDLDDEEATLYMVDTNIQREEILPSEKAFAYKMKLDAIKRQGERKDLTSMPVAQKLSVETIAEDSGTSKDQVRRFIRLTELITVFLDLVDGRKLPFQTAVELSYLTYEQQEIVHHTMTERILTPTLEQATALKKCSKEGDLSQIVIESILIPFEVKQIRVSFKFDRNKYFPKEKSKAEIETLITTLLDNWYETQQLGEIEN